MSYILDALRRAEAERQRGQVPGLGAQPVVAAADGDAARRPSVAALALGVLVVGAALLGLGWWQLRPPAAPAAEPTPRAAAAPTVAPVAAPASVVAAAVALPVVVSVPPAAAAVTAPVQAASAVAVAAVVPLARLASEQRRELPPMTLGGSIWSENAAQRFIIVNGQVVHEGEMAAPGVLVERIGPRAAVLRWRDLRIEWPL